jgi:hypothetical protein
MEDLISLSEGAGSIMIYQCCRQLVEIHHLLRGNHQNLMTAPRVCPPALIKPQKKGYLFNI